jgi:GNAT superfamily N-acetyltransferase|tara:strand:+ start:163 stop:645 length:483 start_codon:yes stop_codon:yes gene_type:complete
MNQMEEIINYKCDLLKYEKVKITINIERIQWIVGLLFEHQYLGGYRKKIEKEIENFQDELNWDEMWSIEEAVDRMEKGWYFNVLNINNIIMGWVWYDPIQNILCNLYVNKEIRKQGYGKQLIYSIMNLAKDENTNIIYCRVDGWNKPGQVSFLRCGWSKV